MAGSAYGKAVYWKNGTMVDLGSYGSAQAIAVSGSDVYAGGYVNNAAGTQAAYWKNGQLVMREDSTLYSHINGIAVSGGDVYCAGDLLGPLGSTRDSATYWVNGVRKHLSVTVDGQATGIFVAGSTVYISGEAWSTVLGSFDSGMVWKNGVPTCYVQNGSVTGVVLGPESDTLILCGGYYAPGYVLNGKFHLLARAGYVAAGGFLGSDVYVAGALDSSNGTTKAVYWKNDSMTVLKCPYASSSALGIAFAGADAYVVGAASTNGRALCTYWKNGVMGTLSDSGIVNAVCVGQ